MRTGLSSNQSAPTVSIDGHGHRLALAGFAVCAAALWMSCGAALDVCSGMQTCGTGTTATLQLCCDKAGTTCAYKGSDGTQFACAGGATNCTAGAATAMKWCADYGKAGGCQATETMLGGGCVNTPAKETQRTQCGDVSEFCDKTATPKPNLDCLKAAPKTHPATPDKVTLTGFVHPFSGGSSNATVVVKIFAESALSAGQDIATAQPLAQAMVDFNPAVAMDKTQFRACDQMPQIGCVPTDPEACMAPNCNDGLPNGMGGTRGDDLKYCRKVNGQGVCNTRLRWEPRYSIPNVPTNTPLVIRTSGTNTTNWSPLVQFNVFLATDDKSCAGDSQAVDCIDTSDMTRPKYQLNVNVLSQADYVNIPATAGLSNGISDGKGGVAGEVHDCDNVRVQNVQVATTPSGDRFTYFNGNPYMTIPDVGQRQFGTDRLGLFSSLNNSPGAVVVDTIGLVGGQKVSFGSYKAFIYAQTVSVININGGKPLQK